MRYLVSTGKMRLG